MIGLGMSQPQVGVRERFLPLNIPGISLWLDAADAATLTLNGSTVSQQTDKSGNGNAASQGTALYQPGYTAAGIDGKGSIDFDGVDDALTVAAAPSIADIWDGGGYFAAVVRPDTMGGGGFGRIFDRGAAGARLYLDLLSGGACSLVFLHVFSTTSGVWATSGRPIVLGATALVEVSYNSDSTANVPEIRVNGVAQTVTTSTAPVGTRTSDAAASLVIGNNASGGTRGWDGLMGERAFYSATPSSSGQEQLRRYLAAKWGITL